MLKIPKKGTPVIVRWLDAVFYQHAQDVSVDSYNKGGELLSTIGFVVNSNGKSLLLASELHEDLAPSRDMNLIPIPLITKIIKL